ncbi:MAG: serine/threonine protein kinase [Acidobacteria bacterium]|nr:serine/threonine protein kinase [Acidobacteriota bacterium]
MRDPTALPETVAAALADGVPVDWPVVEDVARGSADADLIRQLRVIGVIGAARRPLDTHVRTAWGRTIVVVYGAVLVLAITKLALALIVAPAALSRMPRLDLLYWLNMLLFGIAGPVLLTGAARDRRLQLLGGLFVLITSAFVDPLMLRPSGGLTGVAALPPVQTEAFLALALWLFAWSFPSAPKTRGQRWFAGTMTVVAFAVGVMLFAANALRGQAWTTARPFVAGLLDALDRHAPTMGFWPLLFGVAAPAFPFLLLKSQTETFESRRKVMLFVTALGIGLTPMLVAVIASPFVPAFSAPAFRERIGIVLYLALASVVPTTAYAVAVDHVMDIQFVIRKTLQYALARDALWAASLGPLAYLGFDLYRHRDLTIVEYVTHVRPIGVIALSGIGIGALALRQQMIQVVDRWFLRAPADYSQALARLEHGFRVAANLREITRVLTGTLERMLHSRTVAVLLMNQDTTALVSLEGAIAPLPADSALLELLCSTRSEVELDFRRESSVARLLPVADRDWLATAGVQLLSPLFGSTGTLLGVVAVGEPRHGLGYTKSHYALVTALSGQVAMQIENRWRRELPQDSGHQHPHGAHTHNIDWQNEPASYCPTCFLMWSAETRTCSCGAATALAELPLFVNGKFQIERLLGTGGTGVVYLAVDTTLGRRVAIKTLPAMQRENAVRLLWEARAMATVMHPNLALIYGAESWRGTPLLVVEYLEGGTLLESLRRGRPSIERTLELGIILADVLDRIHGAGVLHRDIKPSNIGYTADGLPKLLDFGLAAMLDRAKDPHGAPVALPKDRSEITAVLGAADPSATLTVTEQLVGTPLYLSPEALAGASPQASFDLWSLSIVLYEALAGHHPFSGGSIDDVIAAVRRTHIPDVRDYRPDCPALLAAFLIDALSPVVARRPVTASDLRTHLRWLHSRIASVER